MLAPQAAVPQNIQALTQRTPPGQPIPGQPSEKMPPISPQLLIQLAQKAQQQGQSAQATIIMAAAAQQAGHKLTPQQTQQVMQAVQAQQAQHGVPAQVLQQKTAQAQGGQAPPPGVQGMPPQGQGQIPPALLAAMMAKAGIQPPQGQGAPPQGMQGQGMPPGPSGMPPGAPPPQGMPTPPQQPMPNMSQGQTPPGLPSFMPPQPGSPPPTIPSRMTPPSGGQQTNPVNNTPNAMGQDRPGMSPFARMAGSRVMPQQAAQSRLTPSEQARLGSGGDTIISHLSPGEIALPKELQTPQILALIKRQAQQAGMNPNAMIAGHPAVRHNEATGQEEHSFLGSILPMVAMAAAAIVVPELAPALAAWTPAIVGGVGAISTLATGGSAEQALIAGAGGAIGSWAGGAVAGAVGGATGGSSAASGAADAAATGAIGATEPSMVAADSLAGAYSAPSEALSGAGITGSTTASGTAAANANAATGTGANAATTNAAPPANSLMANAAGKVAGGVANNSVTGLLNNMGSTKLGFNYPDQTSTNPDGSTTTIPGQAATLKPALYTAIGGGLGSLLGSSLSPPSTLQNQSGLPANFNAPSQGVVIGQGGRQPTFTNYNPYAAVTGNGFNFFPTAPTAS